MSITDTDSLLNLKDQMVYWKSMERGGSHRSHIGKVTDIHTTEKYDIEKNTKGCSIEIEELRSLNKNHNIWNFDEKGIIDAPGKGPFVFLGKDEDYSMNCPKLVQVIYRYRRCWTDGVNYVAFKNTYDGFLEVNEYEADEILKSLHGCRNCLDCRDCENCTDCIGCDKCTDCTGCVGCSECSNCRKCLDCLYCDNNSKCYRCCDGHDMESTENCEDNYSPISFSECRINDENYEQGFNLIYEQMIRRYE